MTDLTERLRKRIAEASPLPWVYRPDQYDDWGWIRGVEQESEIGRYRPIVANAKDSNVKDEAFAQHRQDKTDPYGPNALLITEGVNALPDLLTTLETLTQENARLERDRELAIKWANQSVSMLQGTFFPVADALRALEAYLANTPHHNAPEAAAARKVLRAFDACEIPPAPARKALGGGDEKQ